LQELLAPEIGVFYNMRWRKIAERYVLADVIESITGIDASLMRKQSVISRVSREGLIASASAAKK
jgi:hypothetical protein